MRFVMAGTGPAIHVFLGFVAAKTQVGHAKP